MIDTKDGKLEDVDGVAPSWKVDALAAFGAAKLGDVAVEPKADVEPPNDIDDGDFACPKMLLLLSVGFAAGV